MRAFVFAEGRMSGTPFACSPVRLASRAGRDRSNRRRIAIGASRSLRIGIAHRVHP